MEGGEEGRGGADGGGEDVHVEAFAGKVWEWPV